MTQPQAMTRLWIALNFMLKCWLRPSIAWSVAGTCLEMREFDRANGIRREGVWDVGEMKD